MLIGGGLSAFLSSDVSQIFWQIVSIQGKTFSKTSLVVSRRTKRKKAPRLIYMNCSKYLFDKSGRFPFLDIGIVRCDWLRSKPKQSKFGQELLEMRRSESGYRPKQN